MVSMPHPPDCTVLVATPTLTKMERSRQHFAVLTRPRAEAAFCNHHFSQDRFSLDRWKAITAATYVPPAFLLLSVKCPTRLDLEALAPRLGGITCLETYSMGYDLECMYVCMYERVSRQYYFFTRYDAAGEYY
jgi:hypothetical protein